MLDSGWTKVTTVSVMTCRDHLICHMNLLANVNIESVYIPQYALKMPNKALIIKKEWKAITARLEGHCSMNTGLKEGRTSLRLC